MRLLNRSRACGFSLVALLVVVAIVAILLAVAIPNLRPSLGVASEMAVIREIQAVQQAQLQYLSEFGKYASTIRELGPPTTGAANPHAADLIPASLASGEKDGYVFTIASTAAGFAVHANPKVYGTTGRRTFYSDQSRVIHQNWGQEPATSNSPELR
jgi:type IV pilus assembly protein PilA